MNRPFLIAFGLVVALAVGWAEAATSTGSGTFSSATADLPTSIRAGSTYSSTIRLNLRGTNGWPCAITVSLKCKILGIVPTTIATITGSTRPSDTSWSNTATFSTRSWGLLAGETWWDVKVVYQAPSIIKPTDSYSTSHVKYTVAK